jgi:DUF1680 family protein
MDEVMAGARTALRLAIVCLAVAASAGHAAESTRGARALQSFDYRGVTLDGGRAREQLDQVRRYYLNIPNDDLLKGFRARAGRPAPGTDLGGWYSADIFHVFGQVLSGLARLCAATGDEACREKADALLAEWAACIAPDGYAFYSVKPNAPHYIYDKLVGGLVDMHVYGRNPDALTHLNRLTDWAIANLKRGRPYANGSDDTEWYTLSENLYRAYLATGDTKYRDFAEVWEYTEYWDIYAREGDLFGPRPSGGQTGAYHAYSHVNTLGGLGAAYLAKGNPQYLDTLVRAYDALSRNQLLATGGYGPDEQLLPREALERKLLDTHNTFETQCGSWAALKMCKYLTTCTGEARFGDWVERLLLNGIGADIPMDAEGNVLYYSDYNLAGGAKRLTPTPWTCCTGTRPSAVADYVDQVYFRGLSGLFVSQFVPSTACWEVRGIPIAVRQETRFPEETTTRFGFTVGRPVTFDVGVRVPGWLAGTLRAAVNGRPVRRFPVVDGWAVFRERWQTGDRLEVELPMGLWVSRFRPDRPFPAALMHGPVVLAARASSVKPLTTVSPDELLKQLVPSPGEALTYHLASDPNVLVRPYYAFEEGEPYFLYLDPRAALRIPLTELTFGGEWPVNAPNMRATPQVGAWVECRFEGTGIRWLGQRFDDAGIAEVRIDGEVVDTVDQVGPARGTPFEWERTGLEAGPHALRLTVLSTRNEQSKGTYVNVAAFEVIPPADGP